jgi:hypothetical protein
MWAKISFKQNPWNSGGICSCIGVFSKLIQVASCLSITAFQLFTEVKYWHQSLIDTVGTTDILTDFTTCDVTVQDMHIFWYKENET